MRFSQELTLGFNVLIWAQERTKLLIRPPRRPVRDVVGLYVSPPEHAIVLW